MISGTGPAQEFAEFVHFAAFAGMFEDVDDAAILQAFADAEAALTPLPTADPPPGPALDQVAAPGSDGEKAEQLLEQAKREGATVLGQVTRSALVRWLGHGPRVLLQVDQFFNAGERQQLADAMAAVNGTANLLGRSRVRLHQERVEQSAGVSKHSEEEYESPLAVFDEAPLKPLAPEAAVEYFRRLVPRIGVDPQSFGESTRREAFTLAGVTDQTVLEKVKGLILTALESGKDVSTTPRQINALLDGIGVTPRNPQRAEIIVRTSMMDAYATGADQERQDPDVIDTFPVWLYAGVEDGRERDRHRIHFDKYFPSSVSFASVRDSAAKKFDGYNCRCAAVEIDKWRWRKLQAAGAKVETSW